MKQITAITDDYNQQLNLILDDGSMASMSLNYVPAQQGWWYSLTYGTWGALNMRMVTSPNMLRKYRRIIPFGLCCIVLDGYEPVNLSDFISGRANLFVLNSTDVIQAETFITKTLPEFIGQFIQ